MKVLYALANYPQSSESYIEAEIKYVQSQGVEVAVWTTVRGYGEEPDDALVFRNVDLHSALQVFQPDILHIHYLVTAKQIFRNFFATIPVTIRAHSFDWSLTEAMSLAARPTVRAIYAFPHFAGEAEPGGKIVPLPVAYDALLYDAPLEEPVVKDRVVRLAAGRRMKGLHEFFTIAWKSFPKGSFQMAVSRIHGDEAYVEELAQAGMKTGVPVFTDISRARAVEMIRTSGVYLDTYDPAGHPFGMPISVAEAMASGAVVLMRDCPAAREYCGDGACYYWDIASATILTDLAMKIPDDERAAIADRARKQARKFRSDVVLPRLVQDWKEFAS